MFQRTAAAPLRDAGTPDKPFGFYDATVDGGRELPRSRSRPRQARSSAGSGHGCSEAAPTHGGRVALRYANHDFKAYRATGSAPTGRSPTTNSRPGTTVPSDWWACSAPIPVFPTSLIRRRVVCSRRRCPAPTSCSSWRAAAGSAGRGPEPYGGHHTADRWARSPASTPTAVPSRLLDPCAISSRRRCCCRRQGRPAG